MSSPGALRKICQKAFESVLKPLGYVRNKSTFVRNKLGQVFAIDFQIKRFGLEFSIHFGFSYTFFPPMSLDLSIDFAKFKMHDFWLNTWLPEFPHERDARWSLPRTSEEATSFIPDLLASCQQEIDRRSREWRDPRWFLDVISPKALCEFFAHEDPEDGPFRTEWPWSAALGFWERSQFLFWGPCAIAAELKEYSLAREYLAIILPTLEPKTHEERLWQLLERISKPFQYDYQAGKLNKSVE